MSVSLPSGGAGRRERRKLLGRLNELHTARELQLTGVWLFYVQHQFEDVYWQRSQQWSYADAALRGASYLKLPPVLRFFTGNIGLHHVHHLSARIPNYHLQRAHRENAFLQDVPTLSLWDGLRAVRLKLYDEHTRRLVTFAQARQLSAVAEPAPVALSGGGA